LRLIRWSLLGTAVLSVGIALAAQSVVAIWKTLGSVGTPVLLLPLLLAHSGRPIPGRRVTVAMAAAGLVATVWLLLGRGDPWLGIEAIFPGLAVSALVLSPSLLAVLRRT